MCQLFASIPIEEYDFQSRSIRIQGHVTSIRLETMFWHILEENANSQDLSLAQFLSSLYSEVLALHGEVYNFASLLRCGCINYLLHVKDDPSIKEQLKQEFVASGLQ